MVPELLAKLNLPLVGEIIAAKQSAWLPSTVQCVTSTYVQVDKLLKKRKTNTPPPVTLQAGLTLQVRMPPRDDLATTLLLESVGLIYTTTTRYRAAIIRRKTGDEPFGLLETINASAFPDVTRCKVHPHTHSLLQNQQQKVPIPCNPTIHIGAQIW
jgi:hypothetical protein